MSCSSSKPSDLEVLQFLALHASVHADAVECSAQALRDAVTQLSQEDALLREHELELGDLLAEQRRLEELHALVQHARQQREPRQQAGGSNAHRGAPLQRGDAPVVPDAAPRSTFGEDLALWSQAVTEEEVAVAQTKGRRRMAGAPAKAKLPASSSVSPSEPSMDRDTIGERKAQVDAAVTALRRKLAVLDRDSTRRRLQTLENAKVRAGRVNPAQVLQEEVEQFRFRPDVASLWEVETTSMMPAGGGGTSPTAPAQGRHTALSREEVVGLMARGTERVARRYREAMRLLQGEALNTATAFATAAVGQDGEEEGEEGGGGDADEGAAERNPCGGGDRRHHRHVDSRSRGTSGRGARRAKEQPHTNHADHVAKWRSCYAYAALLADERNTDAHMVEALQALLSQRWVKAREGHPYHDDKNQDEDVKDDTEGTHRHYLQHHVWKSKKKMEREYRRYAYEPVATSPTVPVATAVAALTPPRIVSEVDYACLPPTWPVWRELCATPKDYLLPSTRTLAAHRFSFADVPEHQALIRLRIDLQRSVLQQIVGGLSPLLPLGSTHQERDKDTVIANARLGVPRLGGDPFAWCTLLREE